MQQANRNIFHQILRIILLISHENSFAKSLMMSCPAAKSALHIENLSERKLDDHGSLPYRLLHHGISSDSKTLDIYSLLYLQILDSFIRGTNHESWNLAIRTTLCQSILTHLRSHFIQFQQQNHYHNKISFDHFSQLLTVLCSCLLSSEVNSIINSNDQQNTTSTIMKSRDSSSNTSIYHYLTTILSLSDLIQWIHTRYHPSPLINSHSISIINSLYSFISRISYYGATEKLYSHHNRKLCSMLFIDENILNIISNYIQQHVQAQAQAQAHQTQYCYGLITLWLILYSSENIRGKWKKFMKEMSQEFDWKLFFRRNLSDNHPSTSTPKGEYQDDEEEDKGEERNERLNEQYSTENKGISSLTYHAIRAINNLIE